MWAALLTPGSSCSDAIKEDGAQNKALVEGSAAKQGAALEPCLCLGGLCLRVCFAIRRSRCRESRASSYRTTMVRGLLVALAAAAGTFARC